MTEATKRLLEQRLGEFIVPQTARPLGDAGTAVKITSGDGGTEVTVTCGFPADRCAEGLSAAIDAHVATLDLPDTVTTSVVWRISPHAVQPTLKAIPGISNIVAVASGKGGVGKSTVTANVALALAGEGARVGILDADIYGPSQPKILNLAGQRPETRDGNTMQPLKAHDVAVMSIGFLVDERQAVAWRGPMVTSALNQMLSQTDWGELDYLFVDLPPGTGDIQLTLGQKVPVSGAVIVTTPQEIALSDARKGVELFRKVSLPILGVVENMAVHVCSACGHEEAVFGTGGGARMAEEYNLPLLGSLPLMQGVAEQMDRGQPAALQPDDNPAATAFRDTALRIAGELAASSRGYSHLFPNVTVEGQA